MIQIVPQLNILLAYEPVDFRKGIDSLVALCKTRLDQDPISGAIFVFRNRSGTALKLLVYDGQGYWLSRSFHHSLRIPLHPKRFVLGGEECAASFAGKTLVPGKTLVAY